MTCAFFANVREFDACSTDQALAEEEEDHNDSLPLRLRLRYSRASRRTSWLSDGVQAAKFIVHHVYKDIWQFCLTEKFIIVTVYTIVRP